MWVAHIGENGGVNKLDKSYWSEEMLLPMVEERLDGVSKYQ